MMPFKNLQWSSLKGEHHSRRAPGRSTRSHCSAESHAGWFLADRCGSMDLVKPYGQSGRPLPCDRASFASF